MTGYRFLNLETGRLPVVQVGMELPVINDLTNIVESKFDVFACLFELLLNIVILKTGWDFATWSVVSTLTEFALCKGSNMVFNKHLLSKT